MPARSAARRWSAARPTAGRDCSRPTFPWKKIVVSGVESDGMLASGAELGINRDHAGIIELGSLEGLRTRLQ